MLDKITVTELQALVVSCRAWGDREEYSTPGKIMRRHLAKAAKAIPMLMQEVERLQDELAAASAGAQSDQPDERDTFNHDAGLIGHCGGEPADAPRKAGPHA